jgi:hypothetical protein
VSDWMSPLEASTRPGTPILLLIKFTGITEPVEREGNITTRGRLWIPYVAYERDDPAVLGWKPA